MTALQSRRSSVLELLWKPKLLLSGHAHVVKALPCIGWLCRPPGTLRTIKEIGFLNFNRSEWVKLWTLDWQPGITCGFSLNTKLYMQCNCADSDVMVLAASHNAPSKIFFIYKKICITKLITFSNKAAVIFYWVKRNSCIVACQYVAALLFFNCIFKKNCLFMLLLLL